MRKSVAVLLLAISLSACAPAPTPVPAPAATLTMPTPTTVPAPTRVVKPLAPGAPTTAPITIKDVTSIPPQGGTQRTTARLTAEGDLGLGQMELAYPEKMVVNETAIVSLKISPAQQLTSLTPMPAPAKTPNLSNFVYLFSGNIQLYPVMIAELRALKFDIDKPGPIRRDIEAPNKTMTWNWLISPRAPGRQDLAIELSIPTIVNGVPSEISTNVLQDLLLSIQVLAPTPTPAPSPWSQLGDSVVSNAGPIVIALIGLVGTLIGLVYKTKSDAAKKSKKRGAV